MADLKTLQHRIASLSRADDMTEVGRNIMRSEIDDALSAILNEVEETQLLRHLVFINDRNETVGLDVASGRILRVSEAVSQTYKSGFTELISHDISERNDAQTSALVAMLREFSSNTKNLVVQSHLLQKEENVANIGVSANKLCKPLAQSGNASTSEIVPICLDTFLSNCSTLAIAALRIDGSEISYESGSGDKLEILKRLTREECAQNKPQENTRSSENPEENCIILTGHPENGHAIFCASTTFSIVFVMFEMFALEEIFSVWIDRERKAKLN